MMKSFLSICCIVALSIGTVACSGSGKRSESVGTDSDVEVGQDILTGSMTVVVDESVLPLMEEQIKVFRSSYTNSSIRLVAQPERLAINTLLKGEAAVAILTRRLTEEESKIFEQRSISPKIFPIAYDAVVLVRSRAAADSTIKASDIKQILSGGKSEKEVKLLFSSVNSATFRYLKELVGIDKVSAGGAEEVGEEEDVFSNVAKDPGLIGVVSLNQFLARKDTLDIFNNLRILGVRDDLGDRNSADYHRPSQSSLGDDTYPFRQTLYVLNYQPNLGLGIGFSAFLTGDRGQRIVLKSGLLPATMPGREIIIRDNINY